MDLMEQRNSFLRFYTLEPRVWPAFWCLNPWCVVSQSPWCVNSAVSFFVDMIDEV